MAAMALALAAGAAAAAAEAPRFEDSIAQRLLACTGCHGPQGRSGPDGYYPRIAGKPAGYLYAQLQHFRSGRRSYEPMARLLTHLDDAYLLEIARHFAGLELPYPPPAEAAGVDPRRLARGRQLAVDGDATRELPACTACHGAALLGVVPAIPGLLGLPADYINAQLGAWRNQARRATDPDCMARVAARLEPDDIAALSRWLAAQPVPAKARPLASVAALPAPLPIDCGPAVAPHAPPGPIR